MVALIKFYAEMYSRTQQEEQDPDEAQKSMEILGILGSLQNVLEGADAENYIEMINPPPDAMHQGSAACRLFLDTYAPGLDTQQQGDALRMVLAKQVS